LDREVVVIGGGVVGCALAFTLAARGVEVLLVEAEAGLAHAASGTNSGILHTGFDSTPGALETHLILRSAQLRERLLDGLGVPLLRCGARLRARDDTERFAIAALAENAHANGVAVERMSDGGLRVPGESVTDPVALTRAFSAAAEAGGTSIRLQAEVVGVSAADGDGVRIELADGEEILAGAAVNCGGLYADEIARIAGDELVEVYPRKGEFLVFEQPAEDPLEEILLPLPSAVGKGVLVFPTVDGHVVAGPTARDRDDKRDWSVEPDAGELILARAVEMFPALEGSEPVAAYAGLRPAGRGANYVIEHSLSTRGLVHVAAIRSTGLTASLGIAEHVAGMLADAGCVELNPARELSGGSPKLNPTPWWRRAAERSAMRDGG
jgi:glycerol-3-phosphate dehydrogenase